MSRRLLSAAVIVALMLCIVWADHQLPSLTGWNQPGLLISLVSLIGIWIAAGELVEMWKQDGRLASHRLSLAGTTLMFLGACLPIWWPSPPDQMGLGLFGGTFVGLFASICLAVAYEIIWFREGANGSMRLINHVFIFVYFSMLAGGIAFHRLLFEDNSFGLCGVIAVIATVKFSDAAAYAVGKTFGRHSLAPRISAGKTIEGAFGGLLGGVFGALLIFQLITPFVAGTEHQRGWVWTVGYGLVIALAGMLGDLAESIIKRDAHCKDSSFWMPGLGGILDILDSLIFAVPVSCLYWILSGSAG